MSRGYEPELSGDRRDFEEPRRLPKVAAAIAVMALFAGGLWFAYWAGARHADYPEAREAPLIRADARPMMVKPASPGGLAIPDRNMLIYNPNQPMTEHLLPPPEQPMARPGSSAAAVSSPPAPVAQTPVAARPAAAPSTPGAVPNLSPAALRAADVRLQLGSVRSADAARLEWDRIRRHNADLLGALAATPVRIDLGERGVYWRIETGLLADAAANRICNALKERNFGCLIVR